MQIYDVTVHPESEQLPQAAQLAWKIAEVASDPVEVPADVSEMIINRIIDNAAVAVASLNRHPVVTARDQALAHPRPGGATLFGLPPSVHVHAEWAAWANGVAVRELDYHETSAAEYSHPGDNIPPILATAQQMKCSGRDLMRGIAAGYEIQVDLTRAICLHEHKIDHVAHLGPSAARRHRRLARPEHRDDLSGRATGLARDDGDAPEPQGRNQLLEGLCAGPCRKARDEATDRSMRGEGAPSPIYEGEDGVIAWLLGGPKAHYQVSLPAPGEPKRAILETYTKEHSAEYQSQALIDLAFKLGKKITDWDAVEEIRVETSHHTHYVIGTGSNDPQKFDPNASRETLDHSIMYILAVALQDGAWHHVRSYLPERAQRADTVRLWHKIKTVEDPRWTARYRATDPALKAFGGRIIIRLQDGTEIADELAVANAHSLGADAVAAARLYPQVRDLDRGTAGARRSATLSRTRAAASRAEARRPVASERRRPGRCAQQGLAWPFLVSDHPRPCQTLMRTDDHSRKDLQCRQSKAPNHQRARRRRIRRAFGCRRGAHGATALSVTAAMICTIGAMTFWTWPRPANSRRSPISSSTAARPMSHSSSPIKPSCGRCAGSRMGSARCSRPCPRLRIRWTFCAPVSRLVGCMLPERADHQAEGARDIADRLIASLGSMLLYWYHWSHNGKRIDVETEDETVGGHFLHLLHGKRPTSAASGRCTPL